jgi:hypothetical protein
MRLVLGDGAQSGAFVLTILSTTADAQRASTILIIVNCNPRRSSASTAGLADRRPRCERDVQREPRGVGAVRVSVVPGSSGDDEHTRRGATSGSFTTPAVNARTPYWVRVTNACGSYDSLVAYAIPR